MRLLFAKVLFSMFKIPSLINSETNRFYVMQSQKQTDIAVSYFLRFSITLQYLIKSLTIFTHSFVISLFYCVNKNKKSFLLDWIWWIIMTLRKSIATVIESNYLSLYMRSIKSEKVQEKCDNICLNLRSFSLGVIL